MNVAELPSQDERLMVQVENALVMPEFGVAKMACEAGVIVDFTLRIVIWQTCQGIEQNIGECTQPGRI